jgi:hypothetical protein
MQSNVVESRQRFQIADRDHFVNYFENAVRKEEEGLGEVGRSWEVKRSLGEGWGTGLSIWRGCD